MTKPKPKPPKTYQPPSDYYKDEHDLFLMDKDT